MRSLTTLLSLVALSGCATATYSPIDSCGPPAAEVQVLYSMPAGNFKRCGAIQIEGGGSASDDTVISVAKDEARKYGANAIVIMRQPDPEFTWSMGYHRAGTAIAIRIAP